MSTAFVDPFDAAKRAFIDDEFGALDKKIAFCNPGTFGVVPKCVLAEQFKYMQEAESDPDRWMRLTSMRLWLENRQAIAPYFGVSSPNNLAFVTNTTAAVNAVLSSIVWKAGDVLVITEWTYKSIKAICKDLSSRNGVEIYKVQQFPYPVVDEQELVAAFMTAIDEIAASGRNPRLVIVDAISALPSLRFPYEEIVKKLSQRGIEVLVDGAHAPGQIDLNLDTLCADYFAGSLEKWFFCPKGTAVFYVAPKNQSKIRAPVVSMLGSSLSKGNFLDDYLANHFFWQGTQNNTCYACVKKAIEFIDTVGGLPVIMDYNQKLSTAAETLILRRCPRTEPVRICDSLVSPYMKNILATATRPLISSSSSSSQTLKPPNAECIQGDMYRRYHVWTSVGHLHHAGEQYYGQDTVLFRLSAQINNKITDYERLVLGVNHFVKGAEVEHSFH